MKEIHLDDIGIKNDEESHQKLINILENYESYFIPDSDKACFDRIMFLLNKFGGNF